jgi:hypothetical protein
MRTNNLDETHQDTLEDVVNRPIQNPIGSDERPPELDLNVWLTPIRKRGGTWTLKEGTNRLRYPFTLLTDTELAFLREHRDAIKELVRRGLPALEVEHATTPCEPETPTVAPAAARPVDRDARLKALNLDSWRAIHWNDPEEVERRDQEATAVMLHQVGRPIDY